MSRECAASPVIAAPGSTTHLVALVGQPNCGKSTLFNRLTGLRQKVANFPGVTVEHHLGRARLDDGREITLVDLPGIYSLNARSEDERVTRDALLGKRDGLPKPNAVLLVLDSTNLARHLLLAAPVLSLGLPTLVVLNMADDLEARGGEVDQAGLSRELGAPVALISASRGDGLDKVWQFLAGTTHTLPDPPRIELPVLNDIPKCRQWAANVGKGAGYSAPAPPVWTRKLDSVFLHPVWGIVVFALVVVAVFEVIFSGAQPLMDGIESWIAASGAWIGQTLPEGYLRSLIVDGVWGGVGAVVVFLPQILLLFLFIGILEDSGYLARAALIADRTMSRVGLQGKAFIPLLSAYACAVPAIMATRTIESKRDRLATIFVAPFMTCSARLPVYSLLIAAFIPDEKLLGPVLSARTAAMLGLYVLGFVAAVATAKVLKSTVLQSKRTGFVLEMPPYRWPNWRSLAVRLYDRGKVFLQRAGTVILGVAVCLWILANVPLVDGKQPPIEQSLAGKAGKAIEPLIQPLGLNWKVGIGLITSLAAREVIVGTLGTIYGIESADGETHGLQAALRKDITPPAAVGLLIFFAFAMQCMSTVAIVRRETGTWKWAAAQMAYMTGLAYVCAWIAYVVVGRIWAA